MDDNSRDIYIKIWQQLVDGRQKSYEQFDKAILMLSAGVFGISMAFLKDTLTALPNAQYVWILFSSWGLFAISIISTLMSFISSTRAFDIEISKLDDYYVNKNEHAFSGANKASKATSIMNYISAISFVIGVFMLMLFVIVNI